MGDTAIQLKGEDGTVIRFPTSHIAHERATYYADKEGEKGSRAWVEMYNHEYDITMKDAFEAIDWAKNNMDPPDIPEEDVKIVEVPQQVGVLERLWSDGETDWALIHV